MFERFHVPALVGALLPCRPRSRRTARRRFHVPALVGALLLPAIASGQETPAEHPQTVLIRGGRVIDGTGAPPRRADVLVRGDRIVEVGDLADARADRVLDAAGKVVTPGFVDLHAHGEPLRSPGFRNFLAQGVTTVVLGQDGSSPVARGVAAWMRDVEKVRPGVNIALLIGHGSVRSEAGVGTATQPEPKRVEAMAALVAAAMADGCFGLSTGLEYEPGRFADLDELVAVARPVAAAAGVVMSHLRCEDDGAIDAALAELFEQCRRAGCAAHVSHLKVVHGRDPKSADHVLGLIAAARQSGLRVTADCYPYAASYTGIGILFPPWARPPHDFATVVRQRRAELAAWLTRRVDSRGGPTATLLGTGRFAGQTLEQAAAAAHAPFADVLIDDLGPDGASAAYFVMDERVVARFLAAAGVGICSDGSPRMHHPRGYGAFARVLRLAATGRGPALPAAVHKMTGLPAEILGLPERGRIAAGKIADLVVFDPAAVRDRATYTGPHLLAEGIDTVLVAGRVVRAGGEFTGVRTGRVLRHAK